MRRVCVFWGQRNVALSKLVKPEDPPPGSHLAGGFFIFSAVSQREPTEMSVPNAYESERELSASERELLKELALAVRGIRYGSVLLTIHEGRIVEMSKTERVRRNPA